MYTIHILVRGAVNKAEMLPDNLEQAELMVEEQVSQALLELFGEVIVEEVSMTCNLAEQEDEYYSGGQHY